MDDPHSHTARLGTALAGRYKIERKLGEGGMASVYLAEDIKHGRKVALKILRPELAAVIGAERFLSEIKTTANLQHPHILSLFDSGEADGFLYYVMPFIDGETLRQRIERERQLGIDEALRIARDVADALDYAHRNEVIHRDIKPANILLHDGRPVVADFGIALAVTAAGGGRLTETGLSLGTPHYMSPEQASADRDLTVRSDVYSLGCVLYEMLAGQPPHTGPSAQSVLVRILTEDPRPITEVRRSVPPHIAATVTKAIEKLPADRFDSARAFIEALDDEGFSYLAGPRATVEAGPAQVTLPTAPASPRHVRTIATLAGSAVVLAGLAAWGWLRPPSPGPAVPTTRLTLDIGGDGLFRRSTKVTISPDGSTYVVERRDGSDSPLHVRRADEVEFRPLAGTEGAFAASISPENEWISYVEPGGALMRVAVVGSAPLPVLGGGEELLGAANFNPPVWGPDGTITFGGMDGLRRVPGNGGVPEREGSITLGASYGLPDGSGALAQAGPSGPIVLVDYASDSVTTLVETGTWPVYVAELDLILYTHPDGGLFVQRFDADRREPTGGPTPVLSGVTGGFYSVSATGTLVYRTNRNVTTGFGRSQLLLVDLDGSAVDTIRIPPMPIFGPRISPDGRRIAFRAPQADELFLYDLERRSGPTQFTFDGGVSAPVWSPQSDRVAYSHFGLEQNLNDIYVKVVEGGGAAEVLVSTPENDAPTAWADGVMALTIRPPGGGGDADLFYIDLEADAAPTEFLATPSFERALDISPNGRWATYESNETGTTEVYIRQFPSALGQQRVSTGGGFVPRWSPDGRTIYYRRGTPTADTLFAAEVQLEPSFLVLGTEAVFVADFSDLDPHPDGERILVRENLPRLADPTEGEPAEPKMIVIINWFDELRERLGQGG